MSKTFFFLTAVMIFSPISGRAEPLTLAKEGKTSAVIVVEEIAKEDIQKKNRLGRDVPSKRYGEWKAAQDLAHYLEKMTGAKPEIISDPEKIKAALAGHAPVFVMGELALKTNPALKTILEKTKHPTKVFDAEAVVLKRDKNRIYLAGTNDSSHYFAVATLLRDWGCRWYMPTEFGEVIPKKSELSIDTLDIAYAPPFEIRGYWIAWNGSTEGYVDFALRNFMNNLRLSTAHSLGKYTKELIPEGGKQTNIPITDPNTADHIAGKIEKDFAEGKYISLSMEDGTYVSEYARDKEVIAGIHDKYFQAQMMTDAFWELYNNIAKQLQTRYPESKGQLGFIAYVNITIPPQRAVRPAEKSLSLDLAPIDIDPNHSYRDERSPSKQEYGAMVKRWSELMNGKMSIYDYDQSMLVWRDLPNPSHDVFRDDVQLYRDSKIMGVNTESRGATATIFTNLYFRGQLLWNPDADVDAMLEDFYKGFYGPLAEPMKAYWNAIYKAWRDTIVTEHEFFIIPGVYTRALVEELRGHIAESTRLAKNVTDQQILERLEFTQKSFQLIDLYTGMWQAVAEEGDYAKGVQLGKEMLKVRVALAEMNPTFTTKVIGKQVENEAPYWLAGEVQQYVALEELTNGTKGKLIAQLPKEWAFRRDPHDTGLARGFAREKADLNFWEANKNKYATPKERKDYPTTEWEMVRTDLYAQAQGVLHPDWQSSTGYMWYKTSVKVAAKDVKGTLNIHFPGLFSEAWLYVNGELVAHREQNHMLWRNSYRFDWDADLTGKLKAGANDITLRIANTKQAGGIFRRPFIYKPEASGKPSAPGTKP